MYNDVIRNIAKEKKIFIIDLAKLMPKDSRYFYDEYHFTNLGAEKVAEIIFNDIKDHLANMHNRKGLH